MLIPTMLMLISADTDTDEELMSKWAGEQMFRWADEQYFKDIAKFSEPNSIQSELFSL